MTNDTEHAARILTRQFVVPFLLGIKFNLMTILPLLFAGIILLLKKALYLGKFAMFITGLLGVENLFSFGQFGQFGGVNSFFNQPPILNRPFVGNPHGPYGDQFGGTHGLTGGYYKSSNLNEPTALHEFPTTDKDLQFADQFYNFEKKMLKNKVDKNHDKEVKTTLTGQNGRSNTYRNFVWQSS